MGEGEEHTEAGGAWECGACTTKNDADKTQCTMCATSIGNKVNAEAGTGAGAGASDNQDGKEGQDGTDGTESNMDSRDSVFIDTVSQKVMDVAWVSSVLVADQDDKIEAALSRGMPAVSTGEGGATSALLSFPVDGPETSEDGQGAGRGAGMQEGELTAKQTTVSRILRRVAHALPACPRFSRVIEKRLVLLHCVDKILSESTAAAGAKRNAKRVSEGGKGGEDKGGKGNKGVDAGVATNLGSTLLGPLWLEDESAGAKLDLIDTFGDLPGDLEQYEGDAGGSGGGWTCGTCEERNDVSTSECDVCSGPRPPVPDDTLALFDAALDAAFDTAESADNRRAWAEATEEATKEATKEVSKEAVSQADGATEVGEGGDVGDVETVLEVPEAVFGERVGKRAAHVLATRKLRTYHTLLLHVLGERVKAEHDHAAERAAKTLAAAKGGSVGAENGSKPTMQMDEGKGRVEFVDFVSSVEVPDVACCVVLLNAFTALTSRSIVTLKAATRDVEAGATSAQIAMDALGSGPVRDVLPHLATILHAHSDNLWFASRALPLVSDALKALRRFLAAAGDSVVQGTPSIGQEVVIEGPKVKGEEGGEGKQEEGGEEKTVEKEGAKGAMGEEGGDGGKDGDTGTSEGGEGNKGAAVAVDEAAEASAAVIEEMEKTLAELNTEIELLGQGGVDASQEEEYARLEADRNDQMEVMAMLRAANAPPESKEDADSKAAQEDADAAMAAALAGEGRGGGGGGGGMSAAEAAEMQVMQALLARRHEVDTLDLVPWPCDLQQTLSSLGGRMAAALVAGTPESSCEEELAPWLKSVLFAGGIDDKLDALVGSTHAVQGPPAVLLLAGVAGGAAANANEQMKVEAIDSDGVATDGVAIAGGGGADTEAGGDDGEEEETVDFCLRVAGTAENLWDLVSGWLAPQADDSQEKMLKKVKRATTYPAVERVYAAALLRHSNLVPEAQAAVVLLENGDAGGQPPAATAEMKELWKTVIGLRQYMRRYVSQSFLNFKSILQISAYFSSVHAIDTGSSNLKRM